MAGSSISAGSTRMWLPIDKLLFVPETHRAHPRLWCIEAEDPQNTRRYWYLLWEVTHPPTPVVWSDNEWYEFHHSLTTGWPYHQGLHVEVYPTPIYPSEVPVDNTKEETSDTVDQNIRNSPAVIPTSASGKLENTFLTFLTCYKCKKYSFKKVGATWEKTSVLLDDTFFYL